MNKIIIILVYLYQFAHCIDISSKELSNYKLDEIIGIHKVSQVKELPPSQSEFTVYLPITKGESIKIDNENCPKDSQLCGVNQVKLPGKEIITNEIISISNDLKYEIKISDDRININYTELKWGSNMVFCAIEFTCSLRDDGLKIDKWNENDLLLSWNTPSACTKDGSEKKPSKPDKPKDDVSSSWGWFTWLFIFMVIIFAGYVIGNAWINANNNGGNEFLNELIDSLIDVLSRLPSFLKEIWNKIFSNNERGGYSAV